MVLTASTLQSERWLDEIVLSCAYTLGTGAINDQISLPAGLGDVAIMEINLTITSIGTLATVTDKGVQLTIQPKTATTQVDIIGIQPWVAVGALALGCYFSPDPLVLWRQDEVLNVLFGDMDTSGTPGLTVLVKAVRVRPAEPANTQQQVQLVRST